MKSKKFNPNSVRGSRQLKQAGLVKPVSATEKQNFAKLQKKWYAKLSQDGFKDLEWVDHSTGRGQDSSYLRGSIASGKAFHAGRALYYQLASNYLLHCSSLRGVQKFMWNLHASGQTYHDIVKALRQKRKLKVSVYTVFYQLQELAKKCYMWNSTHTEGLLTKRAEDRRKIDESIISEFMAEEYDWIINKAFANQQLVETKKNGR